MRRALAATIAVGLLAGSCTDSGGGCVEPPEHELTAPSSRVVLTAEPNQATGGSWVELSIEVSGTSLREAITGAGAEWQCWDGSAWTRTHQLVKDGYGPNNEPAANPTPPGATVTIPAVGLPVPSTHFIVVPDVAPGTYRIQDDVVLESEYHHGYAVIEVIDAQ